MHRVFAIDALTSSHPLSSREEDIQKPAQISELFDAISYSKVRRGAGLLVPPPGPSNMERPPFRARLS